MIPRSIRRIRLAHIGNGRKVCRAYTIALHLFEVA